MTNKSIRDYINLIENAQGMRGTGNPGMPTPYDQGRNDAKKGRAYDNPYDQPGEEQEHSQYKKGYEQGKKQGVAEDSIGMEKLKQDRKAKEEWIKNNPLMKGKNPVEQQAAWAIYSTFHKPNADKKQGAPDEQLEETTPEAIEKVNQLYRN